jgi:hypothetical protein
MMDFSFISQLVQAAVLNQKHCKYIEAVRLNGEQFYTLHLHDGAFWNAMRHVPKESL